MCYCTYNSSVITCIIECVVCRLVYGFVFTSFCVMLVCVVSKVTLFETSGSVISGSVVGGGVGGAGGVAEMRSEPGGGDAKSVSPRASHVLCGEQAQPYILARLY